jgi:ABC-type amino acid transport system permease subunit
MQWLTDNRQWLFDGIGAAVVIAILGFFASCIFGTKKDSAQPLQKTEISNNNTNQIIVQLNATETKGKEEIASKKISSEIIQTNITTPIPLTKITRLTPKGIIEAIKKAPLLMQSNMAEQYYGLTVEWSAELVSADPEENNMVRLFLDVTEGERSADEFARCEVSLNDYKELKIAHKGTKIKIMGEVEKINSSVFTLKNVGFILNN